MTHHYRIRDAERAANSNSTTFILENGNGSSNNHLANAESPTTNTVTTSAAHVPVSQNGFQNSHMSLHPPTSGMHHPFQLDLSHTSSVGGVGGHLPFSQSHPHELSFASSTSPSSHARMPLNTSALTTSVLGGISASHSFITESEYQDLSLEIEKERHEYLEKSKHFQEQLKTLKDEIEELKVDEKVSDLDRLHHEQQEQGETKYSTIQKVKRGSMQSRVAIFEEL